MDVEALALLKGLTIGFVLVIVLWKPVNKLLDYRANKKRTHDDW